MILGRALAALLLSLILAWGSLQQAVAHSEMAGVQTAVLCDSTGAGVTVSLDVNGNPVAHQPCTHCLAASALAVLADPPAAARPQTLPATIPQTDAAAQVATLSCPTRPQPRAPPFLA